MDLKEELKKYTSSVNILENEPLKDHTSFRIGGPADFFVTPSSVKELADIVGLCLEKEIP